MEPLTVRQATASDKDEVIRILDNVYDGRDYLMEYFDGFISCPSTTPYVGCIDGKIVCFMATFIVDDGKTVVTRAGRIIPRLSGKGIFNQFKADVLGAYDVNTIAFTTINENARRKSINTHILTRTFVRFIFNANCLKSHVYQVGNLKTPYHDDLMSYMSADDVRCYLFPRSRIIVDWVPYKTMFANISLLCGSGQRTKIYSDVSVSEKQKITGLLTFSTTFRAQNPSFGCNLDIYGTDTTTLKDHVISHIRHIQEITDGVTSLFVHVEPEFDMLKLEKVFEEIGLHKNDWHDLEHPERIYTKQFMFEKQMCRKMGKL